MEIIGRIEERKILLNLLQEGNSQFIALYGRRRIGKTYLIRNVFEKELFFETTGLNGSNMAQQIANFCDGLMKNNFPIFQKPTTWIQAFSLLSSYLESQKSKKKKVLFFDEIPWLDTPRSGFLAAFGNFWNQYFSRRNDIILVICGSATSWIINKIVKNKGGLHNRLNQSLRLEPFTLLETTQFLTYKRVSLATKDLATLYMCTGGIPFYLNEVKAGRSLAQIIDDLFLSDQAVLKFEFQNLYAALFINYESHQKVIKALLSKNKGLLRQEIVKIAGIGSGGSLSIILQELEECGFIQKFTPIDKQKEDSIYRLMDEYSAFYYKFIDGNKQVLNGQSLVNSQSFRIWSGFAFENLCMRHRGQIAKSLGFSGVIYSVSSFVAKANAKNNGEKGTQIDLIFDRADNVVNIIEAKFYTSIYGMTAADAQSISNKKEAYLAKTKSRKTIFTTLITLNGAERNKHFLGVVTNELTLEDLLQ